MADDSLLTEVGWGYCCLEQDLTPSPAGLELLAFFLRLLSTGTAGGPSPQHLIVVYTAQPSQSLHGLGEGLMRICLLSWLFSDPAVDAFLN